MVLELIPMATGEITKVKLKLIKKNLFIFLFNKQLRSYPFSITLNILHCLKNIFNSPHCSY